MNWVLMPVHNAVELTKRAVQSIQEQDIPVSLFIVDDASTDDTPLYLNKLLGEWSRMDSVIRVRCFNSPIGVSKAWNLGLDYIFKHAAHALVVNNDVLLRPDTYRKLLAEGGQFVTAVGNSVEENWQGSEEIAPGRRPHPDFSCFMIRRTAWTYVGKFDEEMVMYASDADFHVRLHQHGIEAYCINLPFYHYASGTLKTSTPEERDRIQRQADSDRETFFRKYGVSIGSPAYYELFK